MKTSDSFAGIGGLTQGVIEGGGEVIWAANHWPWAVETHAMNHPGITHVCQDLNQANFHALPEIDFAVAGPSCPGFSSAAQPARKKSGTVRGRHNKLRANAWAVVELAEAKRPQFLLVENVKQFRKWKLYPVWKAALGLLGYSLEEHVLRSSHFGIPQRRDRLVVLGTLNSHPLGLAFEMRAEPGIGPYLDLEKGTWKPVAEATPAVRARVAKARRLGHGEVFLTQHTSDHSGTAITEPIRTITTKDQWAIVRGNEYRPLSIAENLRAMGLPETYRFPKGSTRKEIITGIGNAVTPAVITAVTKQLLARA